MRKTNSLEEKLGYRFNNIKLLELALSHSSTKADNFKKQDNERLEFLGDSVLSLIASSKIYSCFPHASSGDLTYKRAKIVNNCNLAKIAQKIDLSHHIELGQSLSKDKKIDGLLNSSLSANALEALIGAIYLDCGSFEVVRQLFVPLFFDAYSDVLNAQNNKDAKTILQEYCHKHNLALPVYECVTEYDKIFEMKCSIVRAGGQVLQVKAKDSRKKIAEQKAAGKILEVLP